MNPNVFLDRLRREIVEAHHRELLSTCSDCLRGIQGPEGGEGQPRIFAQF